MSSPWLTECERELIHQPGAIQSWGALLIADEADLIVRYASANLADYIQVSAADAIGKPVGAVLEPETAARLVAAAVSEPRPGSAVACAEPAGDRPALTLSSYRLNGSIYIELELPAEATHAVTWSDARAVIEAIRGARSLPSLMTIAAAELRRATGFDRSMVYRFDAIGHGEVVAENCAPDLESFLGLRYPASDVPRQARRLYLRQRVRAIEDALAAPVPLAGSAGGSATPDLSLSALRAVSPVHLQYLRNMAVRATIAVSLTVDGALWGMLVCHHRGPRRADPGTRALADLIGQVTSLMIGTLRDAEARAVAARHAAGVAHLGSRLDAQKGGAAGLVAALVQNGEALMALCEATGVVVRLGGQTVCIGNAPDATAASRLLDALAAAAPEGGKAFATEETGPLLAGEMARSLRTCAAGALMLPLIQSHGDCIVWLRPEQAHIVRWGGDPRDKGEVDATSGALSPRRSFAVWRQEVRGQSLPWTPAQVEAAHALRREIEHSLVRCAEEEVVRLRHHDPLTGLPNRRLLRERLESWIDAPEGGWLLMIELDRFKSLNEAVGERQGDGVLVEASVRLAKAAAAPGSIVARIGSFSFGVLCHGIDMAAARSLAETLRAAMAEPFDLDGKATRLTASIGIAPANVGSTGRNADELMTCVEVALQAAVMRGGNRSQMFDSELRSGAGPRMEIEQELRAVLDGDSARAGALRLAYQPCVALSHGPNAAPLTANASGKLPLRGFEALLRWTHPRLGEISPAEFIPIAEYCGLIEAVGDWVLRQAIEQITQWRELAGGLPHAVWRVAVNVSAHQLARPGFAAEVMALLAARGLPPQCLTIEVTEGVFADEQAAGVVAEMRQAGLKIAVDDFGVGYSSLSYLRRLPADELKLDRCFLQRGDGGSLHEDLLGALVQLARSVGLSVLAEGVETEEHLAAVAASGCDAAQGWLFARALPPHEAAAWIESASAIAVTEKARPTLPFSFRDIVEAANEAVLVTDADLDAPGPAIVYTNPAFSRMTGWKLADVLGRSPRFLQGPKTDSKALAAMSNALREGRAAHARSVNYARSGMPYWCEIRASPLRDQHGRVTHFVAIERDVTHEMRRLDDLEALVERDPLTGIANRRGLERFAADLPQQGNPPLCVAYFDLDGFKEVNDTHGHATGDALLVGVADLLCENIRRVDFVGRLGGDGFVVCMPAVWPSDGHMVSKRLRRVIANHAFATPSGPIRIDCSVGVSAMRSPDDRLPDAITRADAALYAAKSAGRGRVVMESATTSAIGDGTDRRSRHGTVADDALETGDPETVAANLSHR